MRASPVELQALIEAVVVPETWFFRDREAFSTLARLVQEASPTAHADGVRRILSLPSSTGEEPYSIAMALFDAGVPADRFSIDAIDISAHAIAVARRATYGKNSFRGHDLGFRARYFDATATGHRLADRVRRPGAFPAGQPAGAGFLDGASELRRDLLPQPPDLFRSCDAGPRHSCARASTDAEWRRVRRAI